MALDREMTTLDFLEDPLVEYWASAVITNSPKKNPLRILQINCDDGNLALRLSSQAHLVTGIDTSEENISSAKKKRIEEVAEPDFYVGDIFDSRFKEHTFDVVVAKNFFSVSETNFSELLRRIKDVLKPKGRLLIFDCDYAAAADDSELLRSDTLFLCTEAKKAKKLRESSPDNTHEELFEHITYESRKLGLKVRNKIRIKDRRAHHEDDLPFYTKHPMFLLEVTKADNEEDEENEISLFWQRNNDTGTDRCIKDLHSFKRKAWGDMIERYAPKKKKKLKILDIGTSSGFLAITMALRGHEVSGIDISNSKIASAITNAERMNAKVNFICAEADELPFGDEEFDLIINRNVIWKLPNPELAFSQWYRVLRTGGRLIYFDGDWETQPMLETDSEYFDFNRSQAFEKTPFSIYDDEGTKGIFPINASSKKKRPEWDRRTLAKWGLIPLAIRCDVSDQLWDDYERGLYFMTPQFVVVAEKMIRTDYEPPTSMSSGNIKKK
ncbi:MAG: class I SAM-dependent methyltransferase [Eubacteriaceae bacterium]|nr:class I SAM-dependent methyltransferase [Eubacteriaceae bacterium]